MAEHLFISYARTDSTIVGALVAELRELGYDPFFDSDLTGGQRWWDTLLDRIEESDVFIPVLSQDYLDSEACYRESTWAAALGVSFLPIDIAQVDPQLCPRAIADANWVRYELEGRSSLAKLSHALRRIEPGPRAALPPQRPEIPMTYFGELEREINGHLDWERQVVIIATLKSRLGSREDAMARQLLRQLQRNELISVTSWREIEAALHAHPQPDGPGISPASGPLLESEPPAPVVAPMSEPEPEPEPAGAVEGAGPRPVPEASGVDHGPSVSEGPAVAPAANQSGSDVLGDRTPEPPRDATDGDHDSTRPPSGRRTVVAVVAAVLLVAGVIGAVAVAGDNDGDGSSPASRSESPSPTASESVTSTPTPTAAELLAASQPTGVWQVKDYTRTQTTGTGKTTKTAPYEKSYRWTFTSGSCTARTCTGTISSSSGSTLDYIWDGERLEVAGQSNKIVDPKAPCVDSSGAVRPIDASAYRNTYHFTFGAFTGTDAKMHRRYVDKVTTEFFGTCEANEDAVVKWVGEQIITQKNPD